MHTHVVLAHPEKASFNAHLANISVQALRSKGSTISVSNLYAMNFDPCEGSHNYDSRADEDVFHAQSEQRHHAEKGTLPSVVENEIQNLLKCDLLIVHFHLWPVLFPFRYVGFDVFEPEVFHGIGGVAFIENQAEGLSTLDRYSNSWMEALQQLDARSVIAYNRDEDFDQTKRLVANAPVYSPFIRHDADTSR